MSSIIVKTVAAIPVAQPFPAELQKGLGYAGATWWEEGGCLYILNCALADAQSLCRNAKKEEFLWGGPAGLGKFRVKGNHALFLGMAEHRVPDDYLTHARPIAHPEQLKEALDERRTFLSRAAHRRAAIRPTPEN